MTVFSSDDNIWIRRCIYVDQKRTRKPQIISFELCKCSLLNQKERKQETFEWNNCVDCSISLDFHLQMNERKEKNCCLYSQCGETKLFCNKNSGHKRNQGVALSHLAWFHHIYNNHYSFDTWNCPEFVSCSLSFSFGFWLSHSKFVGVCPFSSTLALLSLPLSVHPTIHLLLSFITDSYY